MSAAEPAPAAAPAPRELYPLLAFFAALAAQLRHAPPKRYNRWWFYLAWLALGSMAAEALIGRRGQVLGYEMFGIPSASMAPTIQIGDQIVVDAWRYADGRPVAVGDVVVYESGARPGYTLVKRVVGIPGDQIEMRGNTLVRNGEPVTESYLPAPSRGDPVGPDRGPLKLPSGAYYVLGDNRGNSRDSRYDGPVPRDRIVGRVEYVYYSSDWSRFPRRVAANDR